MNNVKKIYRDVCKTWIAATLVAASMLVHAEINQPNGDVSETATDMQVKVLGGSIVIDRQYLEGRWQFTPRWNSLVVTKDNFTNEIQSIVRNGATYFPTGDGFTSNGAKNTVIRSASINVLPVASGVPTAGIPGQDGQALTTVTGYKWTDNQGNSIDYDQDGRVVSYSDRNNVKVWLQYDANGSLKYVLEHFGRLVFTFTWDSGKLTQVTDNPHLIADDPLPTRTVSYQYSGAATVNGMTVPLLTQVTDVLGYPTKYTYDGNGKLATLTDAENRVKTYSYGPTGRVKSVKEADGAETSYTYDYDKNKKEFYIRIDYPSTAAGKRVDQTWYDAEGRIIRQDKNGKTQSSLLQDGRTRTSTNAAGQSTVTEVDEYGNPVKVTNPDGSFTTAKYSAVHGGILEEIDELGVKTAYEYDTKGNLTKKIEAVGLPEQRVIEYTLDAFGQRTAIVRKGSSVSLPNGSSVTVADASTAFEYDAQGNFIRATDAEGGIKHYKYNRIGNPVQVTDARNKITRAIYDANGMQLSRSNPLDQSTTMAYNKVGERITQTDAEGKTTSFSYDARGRLTQTTDSVGAVSKTEYDAIGQVVAEIDEAGSRRSETIFDLDGRMVQSKDGNGNIISYQYGIDGTSFLLTAIQFPTFTRSFVYDSRLRITEIREKLSNTLTYITKQTFDKKNNIVETTDRNGNKTTRTYDGLGRLIQVTDSMTGTIKYAYDSQANLLALQDANNNNLVYVYDKINRQLAETRPQGQVLHYTYDPVGNLIEFQDAKGNKAQYNFDAANRRIEEKHFVVGNQVANRTISYSYNAAGALTGYTDANSAPDAIASSANYTLDALHRKIEETVTYGSNTFTSKIGYQPTGKMASVTYPDGFKVQYDYDANQVLSSVTLPTGTISVAESQWNASTKVNFPGGTVRNQQYDALMRLTRIKVNNPGQVTLLDYQYSFDAESNITKKDTEHGTYDYGYDTLYRLTQASNPSPLVNESYTYDKLGNRLTDSNKPGTWQYNQNNQLLKSFTTSGQAVNYTYDGNGSLTKKTSASTDPKDNQTFVYGAQNRLVAVQDKDGNPVANYQYDPFGRRIAKTTGNNTVFYLYNDTGLIAEATATGQITTEYGWKGDGIWGANPLFIKTMKSGDNAAEVFYYQNDYLGTPQQVSDQAGNMVWQAKATAFGETQVGPISTIISNLRFPGQYYDEETGTFYNYFRDYDPQTGRYVENDPLGLGGGINTYSYVDEAPTINTDVKGLHPRGPNICNGRDCVNPPYAPTPSTPPDRLEELRKKRQELFDKCLKYQPTEKLCHLCCTRTAQLLRDPNAVSQCAIPCSEKPNCPPDKGPPPNGNGNGNNSPPPPPPPPPPDPNLPNCNINGPFDHSICNFIDERTHR